MSAGRRIPWSEARDIAERISIELRPHVGRLKCVGSVRRKKATVADIEFVAEPHYDVGLFGERTPITDPAKAAMMRIGRWVKGATRMMVTSDVFGHEGLRCELFLVHPPSTWGAICAIRTGPADLGQYVVTHSKRLNRIRVEGGRAIHMDTGEQVPTDTEEQFFALANVPLVTPSKRDAQIIALANDLNRYSQGAGA